MELNRVIDWIKQPWPWYVAGPLIGLMVPLLLLLDNKQFGISSTFRDMCAYVLPKNKISYFSYNLKPFTWRNFYILGVFLGSLFCFFVLDSSKHVGISNQTIMDLQKLGITNFAGLAPSDIFSFEGLKSIQGFILMLAGGFLVGFGTRYADGCTSGHAITGLSLMSPASLVSVIGFFIGGLVSTHILLPLFLN